MNKYQEAFISIQDNKYMYGTDEQWDLLKELVDRATPKKVKKVAKEEYMETGYKHCCPSCGNMVGTITNDLDIEHDDYCPSCGQAIDWSDE